ncbi:MAG: hypothetical protein AB1611_04805 [bacterium]
MNDRSLQYYLVVRPLSEDPAQVEPHLDSLTAATGLDRMTLRQKLIGAALRVLKVHHEQAALEEMSLKLKSCGLSSAVIGKHEMGEVKKYLRASSLEIKQKSITFLSPRSEEILSLDSSRNCLIVLATMNFKRLQGKRLVRLAMNAGGPIPVPEILSYIFRNNPVMDIYVDGFDAPIRIDSTKFNFSCLGENNKYATVHNFPSIIKEIGRISPSVILDSGFGESELPILNWLEQADEAQFREKFALYSSFVYLAYQRGLFTLPETVKGTRQDADSIIREMNGVIWAGPLMLLKSLDQQQPATSEEPSSRKETGILPAPPDGIRVSRPALSLVSLPGLLNFLRIDWRWVKTLGPPVLIYPLSMAIILSFGLAYALKRPEPVSLGLLSLGLILFIHSFVLLQRKKIIENCPTSKIRSMPMGQVEIKGHARQKYYLKSPHTLTDCVYYSYKVYEKVRRKDEYRCVLKESADSGLVPFYLEDETGKALVLPGEAIIHAGTSQTMLGDPLVKIFGASPSCSGTEREIVETVIPVGQPLYVIGFARRLKVSSQEKKKMLIEKIRSLKADQGRLKQYDLDRDGTLSQEEWDAARKKMEEDVLLEGLSDQESTNDTVAVGENPLGGLFYISDRGEERIIRSMAWKIPLAFSLGMAGTVGGVLYLMKFVQNKALLLVLKGFFRL